VNFLRNLALDIRSGLRGFVRNRRFTVQPIILLALGIGGATAMFSVVDHVLLQPLPFPDSDRLVSPGGITYSEFINPLKYYAHNAAIEELANCYSGGVNADLAGHAEGVSASLVSANFFSVLRVTPALGRGFLADEELPDNDRVVILSHSYWAENFGKSPVVLGRTLRLNEIPHTIVGVMPPGFDFPRQTQVWVPAPQFYTDRPSLTLGQPPNNLAPRGSTFGRLQPGATIALADEVLTGLSQHLQAEYGTEHHIVANPRIKVRPLQEAMVFEVRPELLALWTASLFLLLIVCVNAGNLLLARAAARQKEISVRLCLGATRLRIARLLITESLLLGLVGGFLGMLVARWAVDLVRALAPANLASLADIRIDVPVLGFALSVSVLTGVLLGLLPAMQTLRRDLTKSLKQEGSQSAGRLRRLSRGALVTSEVAISLALLAGAGITIRAIYAMSNTNLGFYPARVVTLNFDLPAAKYDKEPAAVASFHEELLRKVSGLPGVVTAGSVEELPLVVTPQFLYFSLDGQRATGLVRIFHIQGDYFRAMGIPLLAGRSFREGEWESKVSVAVVSRAMARFVWGTEDPVGKRLSIGGRDHVFEIIGVVGDITPLDESALGPWTRNQVYFPGEGTALVVRTSSDPDAMIDSIRRAVLSLDHGVSVFRGRSMAQVISTFTAPPRFRAVLFGIFAGVAFALALLGVYGVVSYSVVGRTREIGVRMSLGARSGDILRMIVNEAMRFALAGAVIGTALAVGLGSILQSFLVQAGRPSPWMLAGSAAVLLAGVLAACWIPARRASKLDPMTALRYE